MSQPNPFEHDGELPDHIAQELANQDSASAGKGKRAPVTVTVKPGVWFMMLTWAIVVGSLCIITLVSVFMEMRPPPPPPVRQPTATPRPTLLDDLPACKPLPRPRQGFIVVEAAPDDTPPELLRMNLSGEAQCRLTDNSVPDRHPAISPDGERILFTRGERDSSRLWLMHTDGSAARELLSYGTEGDWSPDGEQIVFTAPFIRAADIQRFDINTPGEVTALTRDDYDAEYNDFSPRWSPDGAWIALLSDRLAAGVGTPYLEICRLRPDGSDLHCLTQNETSEMQIAWLDSEHILYLGFVSERAGLELFVMNVTDGRTRRLTHDGGFKLSPVAGGDGRFIYYINSGTITGEVNNGRMTASVQGAVYRVQVDGTQARLLTGSLEAQSLDVWQPR
ncbi:MAG: hypothetical protein MUE40_02970 [Anaerolineae bacterium]|nr:hypothetical protein [Anaerolineae bacterium]